MDSFYERWGDAPVHSIAAALFLPREKSISLKMLVIIMFHLPIAQLIKKSERQEIVIVILTKILLGEAILVLPNITL